MEHKDFLIQEEQKFYLIEISKIFLIKNIIHLIVINFFEY